MTQNRKRTIIILASVLVLFFLTRFFAFGQMYHQDEYKWAMIVNPAFGLELQSDHPPLVGLLYRATGTIFGFEHLRILPILASTLVLLLAFLLVSRLYGKRAGWWTLGILFVSSYNFIASTQIDIDGALLPLAALCSMYCFYRIDFSYLKNKANYRWLFLFALSVVFGFLIKLSFVLVLAALATEWLIRMRPSKKVVMSAVGGLLGLVALVAVIVLVIKYVFHVNRATQFLENITHFGFLNLGARNYSQVLFLGIKSLVLASPLLVGLYILVLSSRAYLRRYRFWLILLLYNALFYFVLFDFTNRTIERYMMFLIIPSAIIAGSLLSEKFPWYEKRFLKIRALPTAILFILVSFIPLLSSYAVLPLNPKAAYIQKLRSFDWDFLIPITGGSGPIGFYVLVSYVAAAFFICFAALVLYRIIKNEAHKKVLLVVFLAVALVYNLVLNLEYLTGKMYGSVDAVAQKTISQVNNDPNIEKIITYYDIAGYELNASGKYKKRFYTDPMFAESNLGKFAEHEGYYVVVAFPLIDTSSVYWKYLESCKNIFETKDKNVSGYIFDCKEGNRALFTK